MTVKLDIRKTDDGSAFAFHFDRIFLSDIHWGTKHCNAEQLNVFIDLLAARKISLGGDILDLEKIKNWRKDLPPSHFEGMAKFFQRAHEGSEVDFKPGNHDFPLRGKIIEHQGTEKPRRNIFEKNINGITFLDREIYKGPDGRTVLHLHGDQFDGEIAKDRRGFWYNFFDKSYTGIQNIDWNLNRMGVQSRIGPFIKKAFKETINNALNYHDRLNAAAREAGADIVIHGHAHNMGFETTNTGVLKIDDGCATDHVQALGQMKDGTFVLMEMKDGEIRFEDEKGHLRIVNLEKMAQKMGCPNAMQTLPRSVPQEYLDMTYNTLRPVYRMSPSQNHAEAAQKIRADRCELLDRFREIAPKFGLDTTIADKSPAIAAQDAFAAVHALPPDVIADNWDKGLKRIYKLAGRINQNGEELHDIPLPKTRTPKPQPAINTAPEQEPTTITGVKLDKEYLYPNNGF